MRLLCPAPPVNETRLLSEAGRAFPELALPDLSAPVMAQLTADRGVDFATALLYDRVRRCPRNGAFVRAVEALEVSPAARPRCAGRLLVAPAAAYVEHPETGGDGALFCEIGAEFGLEPVVAAVGSGGTVTENARVLVRRLRAETERSVILLSFSKGGADARVALRDAEARRAVRVWVQVCGLVRGTPLADRILDVPWLRLAVGANFAWRRWRLAALDELRAGPGSLLHGPPAAPPGVEVLNVVGFPLRSHVGHDTRVRHARLSRWGPNDGAALLLDQVLEPGWIYPVWGADHYFHMPGLSALVYRLFTWLALRDNPAALPQSSDSAPAEQPAAIPPSGGIASRP